MGARHSRIVMLVLFATIALNVCLFIVVPKGFFPQQDTGRLIGGISGRPEHLVPGHERSCASSVAIVQSDPAVATWSASPAARQTNSGFMFIALKPLRERESRPTR